MFNVSRVSRQSNVILTRILVLIALCASSAPARANGVLSVHAGLDSTRVVDGLDITNNSSNAKLLFDWSSGSGLFSSADCFASTADEAEGIGQGCEIMAGYFMPLGPNDDGAQALSIAFLNHQYDHSRLLKRDFSFSAVQVDWHISQRTRVSYNFSNDWLGGFETSILSAKHVWPITHHWSLEANANVLFFESSAPLDGLEYGELSLNYSKDRWSGALRWFINDERVGPATGFDIEQHQLGVSLMYQLY